MIRPRDLIISDNRFSLPYSYVNKAGITVESDLVSSTKRGIMIQFLGLCRDYIIIHMEQSKLAMPYLFDLEIAEFYREISDMRFRIYTETRKPHFIFDALNKIELTLKKLNKEDEPSIQNTNRREAYILSGKDTSQLTGEL